ncbi:MAG: gamma-glutamyl-gamma-aminobutyrate hydrolase family protein [Burkholderiales bacterium]
MSSRRGAQRGRPPAQEDRNRHETEAPDDLLSRVDGVLLTGSPSNVDPAHYGQVVAHPKLAGLLDPDRDAWTLPTVRLALARGLPILGICRGMQEANVALGGSLYQAVHRTGRHQDHRPPSRMPGAPQYAPAHALAVQPGGVLAQWLDPATAWTVNSLHGQGVDQLAPGAVVEAIAPDGLVEAFSMPATPGFNVFVQWHPEWYSTDDPVSVALFAAFARACADHARRAHATRSSARPQAV